MTKLIYIVCGKYHLGWEEVWASNDQQEAKNILKDYKDNDPDHKYKLKIKKDK